MRYIIFSFFLVTLALDSWAQPIKDVNVVNTPDVNVVNTPMVDISNQPIDTRDLDNPANQSFQAQCSITLAATVAGSSVDCTTGIIGKRMVIWL